MANIPQILGAHNADARNILNLTIETVNTMDSTVTKAQTDINDFINGTGVVTQKHLAPSSVDGNALADATVFTRHVRSGAVTNSRIADESVDHNKLSVDSLSMNKGKDFPLKSVRLGDQEALPIAPHVKNVILDAKVFGAVMGMYYRIKFIANGIVVADEPRYGMTVEERNIFDGELVRTIFHYSDAWAPENEQNFNVNRYSTHIDTIMVDRGDIAMSVTVDRYAISASNNPEWLNLESSTLGKSPTAVIDPANYFF